MKDQPDEEGFLTVVNRKNKPTIKQEETGKKPVLESFYRFQHVSKKHNRKKCIY